MTLLRLPMQEAALEAADSVDPLAARIGAVNTLLRQPDGGLRGYNTDCSAAIAAIEAGLSGASPPTSADQEVHFPCFCCEAWQDRLILVMLYWHERFAKWAGIPNVAPSCARRVMKWLRVCCMAAGWP